MRRGAVGAVAWESEAFAQRGFESDCLSNEYVAEVRTPAKPPSLRLICEKRDARGMVKYVANGLFEFRVGDAQRFLSSTLYRQLKEECTHGGGANALDHITCRVAVKRDKQATTGSSDDIHLVRG